MWSRKNQRDPVRIARKNVHSIQSVHRQQHIVAGASERLLHKIADHLLVVHHQDRARTGRQSLFFPGLRRRRSVHQGWKQHLEFRTLRRRAGYVHGPVVAADDPQGRRQTQSSPQKLRGKERIENAFPGLLVHPDPGIADPHTT